MKHYMGIPCSNKYNKDLQISEMKHYPYCLFLASYNFLLVVVIDIIVLCVPNILNEILIFVFNHFFCYLFTYHRINTCKGHKLSKF